MDLQPEDEQAVAPPEANLPGGEDEPGGPDPHGSEASEPAETSHDDGPPASWLPRGPPSLLALTERQLLKNVHEAQGEVRADFSVGGSLGKLPIALAVRKPGTSSEAVVVELPGASDDELAALASACAPATFGLGEEEVLDEGYRRALSAPEERLLTRFSLAEHGVLQSVRQLLFPDSGGALTARLHALNLYPKGGFFRPHRDTPRGPLLGSLVLCLPVAHSGGELVVSHGEQRMSYAWGDAAAAGDVCWAAFFSDCEHEVLPVAEGTRVTLAYELFAQPTDGEPPARALSASCLPLLGALSGALGSSSFLVNGGRIGFACKHAYPASLVHGITEEGVRSMLKGDDAALLHVLNALHIPCRILRVWNLDEYEDDDYYDEKEELAVLDLKQYHWVGKLGPGDLDDPGDESYGPYEWKQDYIEGQHEASRDRSIKWLGGLEAFPNWILGGVTRFYGGNYPTTRAEFYCALGIIAEVPPFVERRDSSSLAWAGQRPASPPKKRAKHTDGGGAAS